MSRYATFGTLILLSLLFTSLGYAGSDATDHLEGPITQQKLLAQYPVFTTNYTAAKPSEESLKLISSIKKPVVFKIFFGTWCHDSEREVPRLLKLLNQTANSHITLELIGLNHDKEDNAGLAQHYQISRTPTLVIKHNDQEIGRVVETPNQNWAQDIIDIVNSVK